MELIIDDREHNVIPFFNTAVIPPNISYKVSRINYGDYSLVYEDKIIFIIERKTWKDLAASLKDGRSKNIQNLLKIREDTNCILIYLIEGNPIPSSSAVFCRLP